MQLILCENFTAADSIIIWIIDSVITEIENVSRTFWSASCVQKFVWLKDFMQKNLTDTIIAQAANAEG